MPRMHALSGVLYTAEQVRELDRRAIVERGISGYELMTRAGHATLNALRALWPATRSIAVLCGPGNNGGDGYVVARVARAQGLSARVVSLVEPSQLRGDAQRAHADFVAAGGRVEPWAPGVLEADVIVDALYGTGLTRAPAGDAADMLAAANASGRPIVAVDIPSGVHADTGTVLGIAARAALTVSFIGRKIGCYVGDGPDLIGHLVFDDLAVPGDVAIGLDPVARLIEEGDVAAALPRRRRSAHKGDHGHVLVVGGGPGMPGAARLAGEAALRCGAGLVTVALHPENTGVVAARPELMCVGVRGEADLAPMLERATVLAVGPGLGRSDWARALLEASLASGRPVVLDADALNLIAEAPRRSDRWVLTPHPGEGARLLGVTTAELQRDRLGAVRDLQSRYGGTVVLKGAGTLVQSPQDVTRLCDRGNPGMATGGMGDVLTGAIAGILAQCGDLALAARAGVRVHAQAGDLAARRGERGLLAGDVLEQLRACVNP